jgi:hypothetical protein
MSTTYIASKHMPRVRFADHAERLTCKRTFAEETTITQYADRGFLAGFGNNGESHLAGLQINTAACDQLSLKVRERQLDLHPCACREPSF